MNVKIKRRVDEERRTAELGLKSLEALLFCVRSLTSQNSAWINGHRKRINTGSRQYLIWLQNRIEELTQEQRKLWGAKVQASEYVKLYDRVLLKGAGVNGVYLEKTAFERLFDHCEKQFPAFLETPHHAMYYLPPPPHPQKRQPGNFILPEVTLFEDMAALFNEAFALHSLKSDTDARKVVKRRIAVNRACIVASMGFVEAYLNGIAHDYLLGLKRHPGKPLIAKKHEALLLERNETLAKEKFIPLRVKILQYPRIILSKEHPPITEANCPEMEMLIEIGKSIRDAIVHPASRPEPSTEENHPIATVGSKMKWLAYLPFEDVERTVDAAVNFVLRLNKELGGKLEPYIIPRDKNGIFPDAVFS